jgi:hypothetical protein
MAAPCTLLNLSLKGEKSMSTSDPIIIVTGGSVSVEFDHIQLQGNNGKFNTQSKKIKRVEVTGEGIDFAQDTPGGMVTIKIFCENA